MADATCSVPDCTKAERPVRGLCPAHYTRLRRHGAVDVVKRVDLHGAACSVADCERDASVRGWCGMHYSRWQKHGDVLHVERVRGGGPKPSGKARVSARERGCLVDECELPHKGHGYCQNHLKRLKRWGDPLALAPINHHQPWVPERAGEVWSLVGRGAPDDCWLWLGRITEKGYGWFKSTPAHRVVFVLDGGTIPLGWQLDHLCRNRSCVNPKHLEPVTAAENMRRMFAARG